MSSLKSFATLKNSKEFSYLYNNAKKWHLNSIVVFYNKSQQKKVGFTASKKVGNAIKRNFAKRRMRSVFIDSHDILKSGDFIFVAKKNILDIEFVKLKNDILNALKKLDALK